MRITRRLVVSHISLMFLIRWYKGRQLEMPGALYRTTRGGQKGDEAMFTCPNHCCHVWWVYSSWPLKDTCTRSCTQVSGLVWKPDAQLVWKDSASAPRSRLNFWRSFDARQGSTVHCNQPRGTRKLYASCSMLVVAAYWPQRICERKPSTATPSTAIVFT